MRPVKSYEPGLFFVAVLIAMFVAVEMIEKTGDQFWWTVPVAVFLLGWARAFRELERIEASYK